MFLKIHFCEKKENGEGFAKEGLRRMDSKRKGLRVTFAFLQQNYLPDGRVNETVATVEELSDLWKPGAMDGIPLL